MGCSAVNGVNTVLSGVELGDVKCSGGTRGCKLEILITVSLYG